MMWKTKLVYGPVAQWIRHLTTDQGIPGSSPGRVDFFVIIFNSHMAGHFDTNLFWHGITLAHLHKTFLPLLHCAIRAKVICFAWL